MPHSTEAESKTCLRHSDLSVCVSVCVTFVCKSFFSFTFHMVNCSVKIIAVFATLYFNNNCSLSMFDHLSLN